MNRRAFGGALALAAVSLSPGFAKAAAAGRMVTPGQFADYVAAFNRHDAAGYSKYYDDNVLFEGRGRHFTNAREVLAFYAMVKERLKETVVVRRAYFGEDGLAAELETTLVAIKDWPDFFGGPMKVGDVKRSLNFAFYEVRGGKFVHIRSANFAQLT
jgi:hypothetical protein